MSFLKISSVRIGEAARKRKIRADDILLAIDGYMFNQDTKELEKRQIQSGNKKCPACAEIIKAEAKLCKHCGTEQEITEEPDTTAIGADGAVEVYKG